MPDISEAVPGTLFFVPTVLLWISQPALIQNIPLQSVLALFALMVFPIGWLSFAVENFFLTFFGRYEETPYLKYIKPKIKINPLDKNGCIVNLEEVLPEEFKTRELTIESRAEFETLFDPFKVFRRIPFSHRWIQERCATDGKDSWRIMYVESIEDLTFFREKEYATYLREITRYWHVFWASAIGFSGGIPFMLGVWQILSQNLLVGYLVCGVTTGIMVLFSVVHASVRRKEAVAHEHLMIRLRIPYKKQAEK